MQLSDWMTQKKIDDDAMAALINKSRVSVSRYRRGIETPGTDTLRRIVEVTGGEVSANDMLGISEAAE